MLKKYKSKIFPLVVILILAIGIISSLFSMRDQKDKLIVTAEIVKIESAVNAEAGRMDYRVTVKYTANEREYEVPLGYYDSSFEEGAMIPVLVDPTAPDKPIEIKRGISYYLIGIGLLLGAFYTFRKIQHIGDNA